MKIAVFGCSHSFGTWPDFYTWTSHFAERNPGIEIHNYSLGGSSVQWSIQQMLLAKNKHNYDKTIFQITSPYRHTFAHNTIVYDDWFVQRRPNLKMYSEDLGHYIITMNTNYINSGNYYYGKEALDIIYKTYVDCIDIPTELIKWKLLVEYGKSQSDFYYIHNDIRRDDIKDVTSDVKCIETEFGEDTFKSWIIDNGHHVNDIGSLEIAKWIENQIV